MELGIFVGSLVVYQERSLISMVERGVGGENNLIAHSSKCLSQHF